MVSELVREAQLTSDGKALEVGCGTGSHIAAVAAHSGCLGWGVDPSATMLKQVPSDDRLHFSQGSAERLPFDTSFFNLAFSVDVIHHVDDTMAYFREGFRVLSTGGRICTVTDSEEIIRNRRPLAEYWPETVAVELARYPSIKSLRQQMAQTGFGDIEEHLVEWAVEVTDAAPYREKAYSCLHLISEEAFQRGLDRLENTLHSGVVHRRVAYICLWGRVL